MSEKKYEIGQEPTVAPQDEHHLRKENTLLAWALTDQLSARPVDGVITFELLDARYTLQMFRADVDHTYIVLETDSAGLSKSVQVKLLSDMLRRYSGEQTSDVDQRIARALGKLQLRRNAFREKFLVKTAEVEIGELSNIDGEPTREGS